MPTDARDVRTYQREYARADRYKQWLAVNDGQAVCQWRSGRYICGGTLKRKRGGPPMCLWCSLKHAGLCRDCLSPVEGGPNSLRCRDCWIDERAAAQRRYNKRHPGRQNAKHRARMKQWKEAGDPRYTSKLEYKRLWRLLNPDKVRAQKAREGTTKAARDYQVARRERLAEALATAQRERLRKRRAGKRVAHPCTACGTAVYGRAKKCRRCKIGAFVFALDAMSKRPISPHHPNPKARDRWQLRPVSTL